MIGAGAGARNRARSARFIEQGVADVDGDTFGAADRLGAD